ncbi:Lrp/AsnC ligand binding domain-containing protein [Acinetobacter sp. SK-43]|uniref:Lrp/AsnC ligand binding domain-containing protein n=1 Tax=Acinetobacter TaxID=469 RepID=UPI00188A9B66|nr:MULTISPECIES: Lrp/AsnC ligand binding domain-containing protein [Acinetobacter]MBF4455695.1 Lrp/AsnC ligand binding domain-containing protein [Acinetobacter sp. SK-43]MDI6622300.1 Lrp/AsnC ligand binding domain-containing protein [Acinetobacter junii]
MNGPISTLDRTDLKILDILQTDGRISNSKLAELVNLSPTAVMARVQKLTKDEFILGYEAKLNPAKLNANFLVFVEVLLDKTTPNVLDDFIDAVTQYSEIVECHMVSGGFDFLIKLRSAGMEEFRRIAGQILWQLPGVKETRSYPVMQVVKDSSKIKIKSRTKF